MRVAVIFVVLCSLTYGRCQEASNAEEDSPFETVDEPEEDVIIAHLTDDNMVEVDDMLMTREQFDELFQPALEHFGKRVAIAGRNWPNGTIPYQFAADLAVSKTAIRAAMNEWEKHTCVRFIPKRPTDKAYVVIRAASSDECTSNVGSKGGVQYINLAKKCENTRTLLHELGHTIGLLHEHQHPDRDRYIKIIWSNIAEDRKKDFLLKPSNDVATFGIAYDPTSIMHYHAMSSNCQNCKKIEPHDPALLKVMGLSTQLSPKSDIPIVKKMYCKK